MTRDYEQGRRQERAAILRYLDDARRAAADIARSPVHRGGRGAALFAAALMADLVLGIEEGDHLTPGRSNTGVRADDRAPLAEADEEPDEASHGA